MKCLSSGPSLCRVWVLQPAKPQQLLCTHSVPALSFRPTRKEFEVWWPTFTRSLAPSVLCGVHQACCGCSMERNPISCHALWAETVLCPCGLGLSGALSNFGSTNIAFFLDTSYRAKMLPWA